MYRSLKLEVKAADDSALNGQIFNREASISKSQDNEAFVTSVRVGPADGETQISIAPVSSGYFFCLLSDYPVRVRLNGAMATQFTLLSNNVAATSPGAPLPDQCALILTGTVTSVHLQPITSASTTANVKILVTGDPTSPYV